MSNYICVDFDGTIVKHEYPKIGAPVPGAMNTLRALRQKDHKIILFTMRGGDLLQNAVDYIEGHGVQLYGINKNPTQDEWTNSPKAYGHIYIDDSAVGAPLTKYGYIDWIQVRSELERKGYL